MRKTRIKPCAGLLLLSAALAAAPALAADASGLAGRAAAWEKAYNAGDMKGVAALYAADGCRMPTNANWGHGAGTYELMGADGKPVDQGRWMNVSMKSKEAWKIQCDIWNSDLPIPTAKAK